MSLALLNRAAIYSLPTFFAKAVSFGLTPIYVLHLSVSEFGVFDLLFLFGTALRYLSHIGWGDAYMRFYHEKSICHADLTKTLVIYRLGVQGFVAVTISIIGLPFLSEHLFNDTNWSSALLAIILVFFANENLLFYETRYRAENRQRAYVTLQIFLIVLQLIIILPLFLYFKLGVHAIVWGLAIAHLMVLSALVSGDNRWIRRGSFNITILKQVLRYGMPLVPAGLAVLAITAADRFMLNWLLPETEGLLAVGQYALAMKFVGVLALLNAGFQIFWAPHALQVYHSRQDAPRHFARVFIFYVLVLAVTMTAILLLVPWLYDVWLTDYSGGQAVIPILMASMLAYVVGDYFCLGISFRKRNEIRAYAGGLALALNLVMNFLFIPSSGVLGAALATLISNGVYVGILMFWSVRLYAVPYNFGVWVTAIFVLAGWSWVYIQWPDLSLVYGLIVAFYLCFEAWRHGVMRNFNRLMLG